jgi:triacylglycerol esterase/lipase EstA (alpha/beta hydrolase family)
VRHFIKAVLAYTGATAVDIVAHSMGVTLARKAIKGGTGSDRAQFPALYDLGEPLTAQVHTFIAIAGANRGLASCLPMLVFPTCALTNGLHPLSQFLAALNSSSGFEGQKRYSIWSAADTLIAAAGGDVAATSPLPGQTGEWVPHGLDHLALKDQTVLKQLDIIKNN